MSEVYLNLGSHSYVVSISSGGVLEELGARLRALNIGEQVAVITSPIVRRLYGKKLESSLKGAGFEYIVVEIPDGEENKTFDQYIKAINQLVPFSKEKRTPIVNLGGGVVGDIGGFVAATFKRGVPYVQIPTTLLAQVDCAIGGKVGVNLPAAKNYIGAFYQPCAVLEDLSFLRTLPEREILSGLSEIVKYGLGFDQDLFEYVENHISDILGLDIQTIQHVIEKSCEIKARIIENDERDTLGIRQKLNLGHTIGHALEVATSYSVYSHGEAISIGMVCACEMANRLNILDQTSAERVEKLLVAAGLPVTISNGSIEHIIQALSRDKKLERGKIEFILPTQIGKTKIETGIPDALIEDVIEKRMVSLVSSDPKPLHVVHSLWGSKDNQPSRPAFF